MPRQSAVRSLPSEVYAELHRRLVENGGTDFVALSQWLASQGHAVGKTALWKWAKEHREEIDTAWSQGEEDKRLEEYRRQQDIRTTCMAAATKLGDFKSPDELLDVVERLLTFCLTGKRVPGK